MRAELHSILGRNVLSAIQDANNFDPVRACDIKYNVVADGKAAQTAPRFGTLTPGQWSVHKHFENLPMRSTSRSAAPTLSAAIKPQMESRSRSACGSWRNICAM